MEIALLTPSSEISISDSNQSPIISPSSLPSFSYPVSYNQFKKDLSLLFFVLNLKTPYWLEVESNQSPIIDDILPNNGINDRHVVSYIVDTLFSYLIKLNNPKHSILLEKVVFEMVVQTTPLSKGISYFSSSILSRLIFESKISSICPSYSRNLTFWMVNLLLAFPILPSHSILLPFLHALLGLIEQWKKMDWFSFSSQRLRRRLKSCLQRVFKVKPEIISLWKDILVKDLSQYPFCLNLYIALTDDFIPSAISLIINPHLKEVPSSIDIDCFSILFTSMTHQHFKETIPIIHRWLLRSPFIALSTIKVFFPLLKLDLSRYIETLFPMLMEVYSDDNENIIDTITSILIDMNHHCSEYESLLYLVNQLTSFFSGKKHFYSVNARIYLFKIIDSISICPVANKKILRDLANYLLSPLIEYLKAEIRPEVKPVVVNTLSSWFKFIEIDSSSDKIHQLFLPLLLSGLKEPQANICCSFTRLLTQNSELFFQNNPHLDEIVSSLSNILIKATNSRVFRSCGLWACQTLSFITSSSSLSTSQSTQSLWIPLLKSKENFVCSPTYYLSSDVNECESQLAFYSMILDHHYHIIFNSIEAFEPFFESFASFLLHPSPPIRHSYQKLYEKHCMTLSELHFSILSGLASLLSSNLSINPQIFNQTVIYLGRYPLTSPRSFVLLGLITHFPFISCNHKMIRMTFKKTKDLMQHYSMQIQDMEASYHRHDRLWNKLKPYWLPVLQDLDLPLILKDIVFSSQYGIFCPEDHWCLATIYFIGSLSSLNYSFISSHIIPYINDTLKNSIITTLSDEKLSIAASPIGTYFETDIQQASIISRAEERKKGKKTKQNDWEKEYDEKEKNQKLELEKKKKIELQDQIRYETINNLKSVDIALQLIQAVIIKNFTFKSNFIPEIFSLLPPYLKYSQHPINQQAFYCLFSCCVLLHKDLKKYSINIASLLRIIISNDPVFLMRNDQLFSNYLVDIIEKIFNVHQITIESHSNSLWLSDLDFLLIFPLLETLIQALCTQDIITEEEKLPGGLENAVNIISLHSLPSIRSNSSSSFPLIKMVELLLLVVSHYPSLHLHSEKALVSLTSIMDILELNIFINDNALLSPLSEVRNICLISLKHFPHSFQFTEYPSKMIKEFFAILWIICFDENDKNKTLALELWNQKFHHQLSKDIIFPVCSYVTHSCEIIRQNSSRALSQLLSSYPQNCHEVLEYFFNIYSQKELEVSNVHHIQNGVAFFIYSISLSSVSNLDLSSELNFIFNFFINSSLRVQNTNWNLFLNSGSNLVENYGASCLNILLPLFENSLNSVDSKENVENEGVREAIIVFIGKLSKYIPLDDKEHIINIIDNLIDVLDTPSRSIQIAASECISTLMPSFPEESEKWMNLLIHRLSTGSSSSIRKGAAFGIAAMVKAFKISSLKKFNLMEKLSTFINDTQSSLSRQGALFAFERLSAELGFKFEPYIVNILPFLLKCFGDNNSEVRNATLEASRIIMSNLTNYGIRLVLPILLNGLESNNWRTQVESVRLLGTMAHCAPNQLSSCLPQAVPKILKMSTTPHKKIRENTAKTLEEIGSVIRNPEIHNIVPYILPALIEPVTENLTTALNHLSRTKFIHSVDAPSLALIMPLCHQSLNSSSISLKKQASQITGHLIKLVSQPEDLSYYAETLSNDFRKVIIDPIPEVRAFAAKALGQLYAGIGGEYFSNLPEFLKEELLGDTTKWKRAGCAHALAEIIAASGPDKIQEILPEIQTNSQNAQPHVREGYLSLYIYLPKSFGEEFSVYVPTILPNILNAMSDETEIVRDVAFRAGQVVVLLYAHLQKSSFINILYEHFFHTDWRVREGSLRLFGDFLHRLCGNINPTSVIDEEKKETKPEIHIDIETNLLRILGIKIFEKIFSVLYLSRFDVSALVKMTALYTWKSIVNNTPKLLRQILPSLLDLILISLANSNLEQQQTAGECLGELVSKIGEHVLTQIVPIFEKGIIDDNKDKRLGVCFGVKQIIFSASKNFIGKYLPSLIPIIRQGLCDDVYEVRKAAASTFKTLVYSNKKTVDEVVPALLEQLFSEENQNILSGLFEILNICSTSVIPLIIPVIMNSPLTPFRAYTFEVLAPSIQKNIDIYLHQIIMYLIPGAIQEINLSSRPITYSIQKFLSSLTNNSFKIITSIVEIMESAVKLGLDPRALQICCCDILTSFLSNCEYNYKDLVPLLIESFLRLYISSDQDILASSVNAFNSLISSISKDELIEHNSYIRRIINNLTHIYDIKNAIDILPGFCFKHGNESLLALYQHGLFHGDPYTREESAIGIGEVVTLTSEEAIKPNVIKITGPLIRVASDRFPSKIKVAIFNTLNILLEKSGKILKPFLPQLQTTFIKALLDTSTLVRQASSQCLTNLLTFTPRFEQIINELMNNIKCLTDNNIRNSLLITLYESIKIVGSQLSVNLMTNLIMTLSSFLHDEDDIRIPSSQSMGLILCFLPEGELFSNNIQKLLKVDNEYQIRHSTILIWTELLKNNFNRLLTLKLIPPITTFALQSLQDDNSTTRNASLHCCYHLCLQSIDNDQDQDNIDVLMKSIQAMNKDRVKDIKYSSMELLQKLLKVKQRRVNAINASNSMNTDFYS